ncbi:MAG: hypothetical protein R2828_23475 [Saprospiraceae bacterium]
MRGKKANTGNGIYGRLELEQKWAAYRQYFETLAASGLPEVDFFGALMCQEVVPVDVCDGQVEFHDLSDLFLLSTTLFNP